MCSATKHKNIRFKALKYRHLKHQPSVLCYEFWNLWKSCALRCCWNCQHFLLFGPAAVLSLRHFVDAMRYVQASQIKSAWLRERTRSTTGRRFKANRGLKNDSHGANGNIGYKQLSRTEVRLQSATCWLTSRATISGSSSVTPCPLSIAV